MKTILATLGLPPTASEAEAAALVAELQRFEANVFAETGTNSRRAALDAIAGRGVATTTAPLHTKGKPTYEQALAAVRAHLLEQGQEIPDAVELAVMARKRYLAGE